MKIGSIAFVLIAHTLWFCGSHKSDWRNDLSKINRDSLFQNSDDGWELSTKEEYPNSVLYNIRKKDSDTTKLLSFFKSESGLSVKEYLKYYPENGDTCYLKMVSSDTLYFYRQRGDTKNFIVGEYGYRYTSMLLEDYELDYYLKHEDSLRRVRGSNLPKLPKK